MKQSKVKTERLALRGIEEGDGETIVKWRSNPAVYKYFSSPRPITLEEHRKWFRESYLCDANRMDWIAESVKTGTPVGLFNLKRTGGQLDEVAAGYLLAPEEQHKGYAREAVDGLLEWAKRCWGSRTAVAEIQKDNSASLRFIEGLGFQKFDEKGQFEVYRKTL